MDQPLTPAMVIGFLTFLTLLAGLWWRVETRISAGSKDAMKKADEAFQKAELSQSQLNDFKLEVAGNYAKNGFLKDVENRLGQRFDAIVSELHGMRQDFNKVMVDTASRRNTQR
jgi:hypothetical protein